MVSASNEYKIIACTLIFDTFLVSIVKDKGLSMTMSFYHTKGK